MECSFSELQFPYLPLVGAAELLQLLSLFLPLSPQVLNLR